MLLANGLSKSFIKSKLTLIHGPRKLSRNPPDCTIWDSWVFDNFILADKSFRKALWSFETWLSVSDNSYEKLVSSLESTNNIRWKF